MALIPWYFPVAGMSSLSAATLLLSLACFDRATSGDRLTPAPTLSLHLVPAEGMPMVACRRWTRD